MIIKRSDIEEIAEICPYCMTKPTSMQEGCCGESSDHWQEAYGLRDDSGWTLAEEVTEIIEDVGNDEIEKAIGEFINE